MAKARTASPTRRGDFGYCGGVGQIRRHVATEPAAAYLPPSRRKWPFLQ